MTDRSKLIFSPCDVLLPPYAPDSEKWKSWSVIACDQHTGDVSYWDEVKSIALGHPSTFNLILPEAYLGSEEEAEQKLTIGRAMKSLDAGFLTRYKHALVYVERTLAGGEIRRGLVGKVDLECYDYSKDTVSAVRPTEGTVAERIPPRMAVRREAVFEAPHVMVFINDERDRIIESLSEKKDQMKLLYDFDLMLGGGHVCGYLLGGELLEEVLDRIYALEEYGRENGVLIYGVGDGNHSLATAKACYEELKKADGAAIETSKARFAAVELVSVFDESIVFEPIYRIVKGIDTGAFTDALEAFAKERVGDGVSVGVVTSDFEREITLPVGKGELTVGVLQDFIDEYVEKNGGECDYIHDEDVLRSLAGEKNSVGLLFDGIGKDELFPYVANSGALPRKTFSMGDASSKRYYLEVRRIKEIH